MIKNRELALIPDSALGLVEPPATSPPPRPRASTGRPAGTPRAERRQPRHPEPAAR